MNNSLLEIYFNRYYRRLLNDESNSEALTYLICNKDIIKDKFLKNYGSNI